MNARTALVVALACGALAVSVVAVDLAFTLVLRIEGRVDGAWKTFAVTPADGSYGKYPYACAPREMRFVADNHRPSGASGDLHIYYGNVTGTTKNLLQTTWVLAPFESRGNEFTIPDEAFSSRPGMEFRGFADVTVFARFGDQIISQCVEREA